ncbi:MAG: hypothetical protein QOG69_2923, partial [Actinomycetota bacterium]|nr:hypothetical protein [Actinomycetota bacterium]
MSKQSDEVATLYRNWVGAIAANPEMPLDEWRDLIEGWPILTGEPGGVDY